MLQSLAGGSVVLGSMILEGKRSGRVLVFLTPDPQSRPSENLILDVQEALSLERASPSPNEINILFLEEFLSVHSLGGVQPSDISSTKTLAEEIKGEIDKAEKEIKKPWYSTKKE